MAKLKLRKSAKNFKIRVMETQTSLNSKDTLTDVVGGGSSPRHDAEYQQFIK